MVLEKVAAMAAKYKLLILTILAFGGQQQVTSNVKCFESVLESMWKVCGKCEEGRMEKAKTQAPFIEER
jgi:hypothetical protein